ncbi:MAG: amidohydrolase family protein [Myxococcota bacterium]
MNGLLAAIALVGVTVHTGSGPPLENGTVLIEGNRIAAVGPSLPLPDGTEVLRLDGAVVTAGLIDCDSRLGLTEVVAEPSAVEAAIGEEDDPVRAALRVTDGFDPSSFVIPVARLGGLTSAVIMPRGGLVSGQAAWIDLIEREPIRRDAVALLVRAKRLGKGAGGRTRAFHRLREIFEDARLYRANRGPFIARKLRVLSLPAADLEVIARALDRELLIVFEADRAADIRTVLGLVRDHRLRAALLGGAEAWTLASEIAAAGVPVLMDPIDNLPASFDSLRIRSDGAVRLHRAGVRVAFTLRGEAHRAARLRHVAGNAVAEGFPYQAALAAITRVPAEIFGLKDAGVVEPGALANLVVWNGDPLELRSWPIRIFIRGRATPLRSRQDLLTERYSEQQP